MEWIKHWKHLTLTFLKIVEGTIREPKEIASWLRNSFRKVQFEFFRHSLGNSLKSEQFDRLLYFLQNRTFLGLFNQYPTCKQSNWKKNGCFGGKVWQSNCEKGCCSMKNCLLSLLMLSWLSLSLMLLSPFFLCRETPFFSFWSLILCAALVFLSFSQGNCHLDFGICPTEFELETDRLQWKLINGKLAQEISYKT